MKAFALAIALAAAWLALPGASNAQVFENRSFEDPENARRYRDLIRELRCLVCQNQNLADSNAELAADLRQITYEMIRAGKSDAEIIDFMVSRYGDFVLYRPPFKPETILLWAGPFLFLAAGLWLLLARIRRRETAPVKADPLSGDDRSRLQRLLDEDDPHAGDPRDP